ncbi:MAG: amidohydrolase, partial [Cyanobacteria bacterium J06573_2]
GKQIVGSGTVKNIDVDNLKQELFKHSEWQTKRKSKTVKEIETHYRQVMGL